MFNEWQDAAGRPRDHYGSLADAVTALGADELCRRWQTAHRRGRLDAFTFYLDPRRFRAAAADWLPRVIPRAHWEVLAAGVGQRLKAINRFLLDLYHGGQDIVPDAVVYTAQHFYPEVQGFRPPRHARLSDGRALQCHPRGADRGDPRRRYRASVLSQKSVRSKS